MFDNMDLIVAGILIATGLYFTIRIGFFQLIGLPKIWKNTIGKLFKKGKNKDKKDDSSRTISTVLGGTIGAGNVAGVATAVAAGGPGAIFWMWVVAFFGMANKFVEVMMATKHQQKEKDGTKVGGPMYYIKTIGGKFGKILAVIYTIILFCYTLIDSGFVQINTVADSLSSTFSLPLWPIAIVSGVLAIVIVSGGLKRISDILESMVPFMYLFYIIGALIVIFANVTEIPAAFANIFTYAFKPAPIVGGFAGATVMNAISKGACRGVFANEAGLGTSTTVHSTSNNDPVTQGMWGMVEVAVVSFIMCTLTAFLVLTTGAYQAVGIDGEGLTGAAMVLEAFQTFFGANGKFVLCIVLVTFCYTTYLGFFYEFRTSLGYLFKEKLVKYLKWIYIIPAVVAVFMSVDVVWDVLCDTAVGLIVIPNMLALIILSKDVVKTFKTGKAKLAK